MTEINNKNVTLKFNLSETLYKRFYRTIKDRGIKVNDRIRQLIAEDTEKNEVK
jgi:hypothetical protein